MNTQHFPGTQRGSALIVSLVFLVVLTILGVATMNTSRLEIKMASNQQSATQAFLASASGIEQTLDETDIYDTNSATGVDKSYYYNQTSKGLYTDGTNFYKEMVQTNTLFEVRGDVPAGGFSLGSKLAAYHFRILSTGQSVAGSENQQFQGFYKVGPG